MRKNLQAIVLFLSASLIVVSCSKYADQKSEVKTNLTESQLSTDASLGSNQMESDPIVFTQVVQLEGAQEVPAVQTETKGIAILRVSKSKKLYSKIIIQKLADGDALRFAHVHAGMAGMNGPVRITLAANASEFGINKVIQLNDIQYTLVTEGAAYVNAHSNFFPGGIVRGQIVR